MVASRAEWSARAADPDGEISRPPASWNGSKAGNGLRAGSIALIYYIRVKPVYVLSQSFLLSSAAGSRPVVNFAATF